MMNVQVSFKITEKNYTEFMNLCRFFGCNKSETFRRMIDIIQKTEL